LDGIEILPLADMHMGDRCCDFKLIQRRIEYIRDTPNVYCILNGDLMDTAIASSIGDTYAANLAPMEQLKQCVKIFEPIKDKIICITSGNHENRVYKQDGLDLTEIMAAQLGLSEAYTDTTAILFVRLGKLPQKYHGRQVCYTIYVTHGSGGGRKEGGKINRLADLAAIVDTDCYVCSHTHLPAIFKTAYYRADPNNSAVSKVDKLFVNTAGFLDYGGYGDRAGYKPTSTDTPTIYLSGRSKQMTATL
jgi:predicted MPP superfamily phosphohydrolase